MTKRIPNKAQARARTKKSTVTSVPQPETVKRPSGKLGLILDRLESKKGATVGELVEVTDWQSHSVLGALSRLRTRGFAIRLQAEKGRRVYRLSRAGQ